MQSVRKEKSTDGTLRVPSEDRLDNDAIALKERFKWDNRLQPSIFSMREMWLCEQSRYSRASKCSRPSILVKLFPESFNTRKVAPSLCKAFDKNTSRFWAKLSCNSISYHWSRAIHIRTNANAAIPLWWLLVDPDVQPWEFDCCVKVQGQVRFRRPQYCQRVGKDDRT